MEHKLIFIGEEFYANSGTMMSSIYGEDGARWDWGKVKIALEDGDTVTIRPCTMEELRKYRRILRDRKHTEQNRR